MDRIKKELVASIILKSLIVVGAIVGVVASLFVDGQIFFSTFLYYTIQSNIAVAVVAIILIVCQAKALKNNEEEKISNKVRVIKFIFTVAIFLTGLVFNCVLLPVSLTSDFPMNPFSLANFLTHIFVPILSIVDYILFDYKLQTSHSTFVLGITTIDIYFVFAMICSVLKVDFHSGYHYVPYFFLDYVNNGWFTLNFAKGQIGLVYGGIFINGFVLFLSWLLIFIKNKRAKHAGQI